MFKHRKIRFIYINVDRPRIEQICLIVKLRNAYVIHTETKFNRTVLNNDNHNRGI